MARQHSPQTHALLGEHLPIVDAVVAAIPGAKISQVTQTLVAAGLHAIATADVDPDDFVAAIRAQLHRLAQAGPSDEDPFARSDATARHFGSRPQEDEAERRAREADRIVKNIEASAGREIDL